MTNKEFENWNTLGTSLFTKTKAILLPELASKTGAIYNKFFTGKDEKDEWIVDIKLRIGNEDQTLKGGNGVGIFYLRNLNGEDFGQG